MLHLVRDVRRQSLPDNRRTPNSVARRRSKRTSADSRRTTSFTRLRSALTRTFAIFAWNSITCRVSQESDGKRRTKVPTRVQRPKPIKRLPRELVHFFSRDASRSRHAVRSIPGPRTGAQRSPTLSSRRGRVCIANLVGSIPRLTSDHSNGVETMAFG